MSVQILTIDVREINFTQDSASSTFKDGTSIANVVTDIKTKNLKIEDIPKIRVVRVDGKYYSLDNRRLAVFKEALKYKRNQQIVVEVLEPTDKYGNQKKHPGMTVQDDFNRKMTSKKSSEIMVKDGQPNWVMRTGPKGGKFVYDKEKKKIYISQLSAKAIEKIGEKDHKEMQKILQVKADIVAGRKESDGDIVCVVNTSGTQVFGSESVKNMVAQQQYRSTTPSSLRNNGTPEMRYHENRIAAQTPPPPVASAHRILPVASRLTKHGAPDMRYRENRIAALNPPPPVASVASRLTKHGAPDMRYRENQIAAMIQLRGVEQRRAAAEEQRRAVAEEQRRAVAEEQRRAVAEEQRRAAEEQRRVAEERGEQRQRQRDIEQRRAAEEQRRVAEEQRQRQLLHAAEQQMRSYYTSQYAPPSSYSSPFGGYSSSGSRSSYHNGPRCLDGSLDMRYSVNKGHPKYG